MGLDMYLEKFPADLETETCYAVENYLYFKKKKEENPTGGWELPPKPAEELIERCQREGGLVKQVGYWRKANAIHNWFSKHNESELDDCEHMKVSKEMLIELKNDCEKVLGSSQIAEGLIMVGKQKPAGSTEWENIYDFGDVMLNTETAETVLPTQSGFFFGSTEYDKFYLDDLRETIEIVDRALNETDFDKEVLYYHGWW